MLLLNILIFMYANHIVLSTIISGSIYMIYLLFFFMSIILYAFLVHICKIKFEYRFLTIVPICTLMIIFFHFYMKWKSKDCELIKYKAPIVRTIHGGKGPICLNINFKGDTVRTYYPFYKLSWNERGNVYDGLYNAVLSLKEPMDGYIIIEDIEFVRKE